MVLLDCLANLSIIGVLFLAFPVRIFEDTHLCYIIETYRGLSLVINRSGMETRVRNKQINEFCSGSFLSLWWSTES